VQYKVVETDADAVKFAREITVAAQSGWTIAFFAPLVMEGGKIKYTAILEKK